MTCNILNIDFKRIVNIDKTQIRYNFNVFVFFKYLLMQEEKGF